MSSISFIKSTYGIVRGLRAAAKNVVQHRQWKPICNVSTNSTRSDVSEMEISAFEGKILRLIRKEIQYALDYSPPSPHIPEFGAFKVDERPGEQFIRLHRKYGETEDVKVEVTMFDGSVPFKKAGDDSDNEDGMKLHITLIVDIFKRGSINVLEFVCSAWPDNIEIRKVFTRGLEQTKDRPYLGPDFKELDDEMQNSLYDFLGARGVDDNLAVFLHRYTANKDKVEYVRWMEKVYPYFQKSRS
ncbi:uncharacterized protein At2g39795, mitochondrial-like [Henckelia pumila]|uniref:uncharacterized protein At2g39795, mitochondrial-like n=1 Tax=Henckelia pumila TaxID=405737 RepID=UPI003C6DC22B